MNKYICAFRGRRDNYQIPLALGESGLLEQFITDFYTNRFLQKISPFFGSSCQSKLDFRLETRIPSDRIKSLWANTLLEHCFSDLNFPRAPTYA